MLTANTELYRGLSYPWGREADPGAGVPQEIVEGVYWVRFPMPMSLDHINIWLLEEKNGWTVVDTCLNLPDARAIWENLLSGHMKNKPVLRVICTHMHPDHVGLAGWLVEKFDCSLWMSREEFLMCRTLAADTGKPAPDIAVKFYAAAGYSPAQLEQYKNRFGMFGFGIAPIPPSYRRLVASENLTIGDRYWQVVIGSGHSPEHVCLYCPALKCLISGDQVLPRISPNVSVFPTEPDGDPLKEWLISNARIRELLPDDLLVLPSHEAPFNGLHARLSQLIDGHNKNLDRLYEFLEQPKKVIDCFPALFKREIGEDSLGLATGETIAHLNCLMHRGQISREKGSDGVYLYKQI